jgi:hypothetical protein
VPAPKGRQKRQRPSLYDDAARAALIVLWEASDRVCGKRLKALLPILLSALERNGHLKLNAEIRPKILSMSARDHRPAAADAKKCNSRSQSATSRAGTSTAHQDAHLRGLE